MAGRPIEGAGLFAIILEGLEKSVYQLLDGGGKVNEHSAIFFF